MEQRVKIFASFLFRLIRVILVLAVAGAVAFWLYAIRPQPEKKEPKPILPSVRVMEVFPQSRVMTIESFGTIVPRKQVKIVTEVPGRIEFLHPAFVKGGFVRDQELLIRIDQQSYVLEKEGATVRVAQAGQDIAALNLDMANLKKDAALAQANAALTLKELARIKALSQNQVASQTSLDKAEQQHLAARIQWQAIENRVAMTGPLMEMKKSALAMARVEFNRAALALEKTQIRAGFDGYVIDKLTEQGEYVNPGQPLGSLYEKGALDLEVNLSLDQMKWIQKAFDGGNLPRARVFLANVDSSQEAFWEGQVARVMAKIDEKTRTLPLIVEIDDLKTQTQADSILALRPGAFVRCEILGETHENIFVVPRHLLRSGDILWVVTDGRLEKRNVTLLRRFEEEVYIQDGLNSGDQIIVSPLPTPIEGMGLTIKASGS